MSINTWDPNASISTTNSYLLNIEFLQKIINDHQQDSISNIQSYLSTEEQKQHQPIMKLAKESWFAIKEQLSDEDIVVLIKFFTLAEMQFSDWTAEEYSPVIWLSKIFRQRGKTLDKDLLLWIKSTSNNKFLPYGPL